MTGWQGTRLHMCACKWSHPYSTGVLTYMCMCRQTGQSGVVRNRDRCLPGLGREQRLLGQTHLPGSWQSPRTCWSWLVRARSCPITAQAPRPPMGNKGASAPQPVPQGAVLDSQGRHVPPSARNLSQRATQAVATMIAFLLTSTKAVLFLDRVNGLWE